LPYSKTACDKLQTPWISGSIIEDSSDDESEEGAKEAGQVTPIDDDDKYEDTVHHLSTGVKDILVTGKVNRAVLSAHNTSNLSLSNADERRPRRCMGSVYHSWSSEFVSLSILEQTVELYCFDLLR
jgi:hypothetical protein